MQIPCKVQTLPHLAETVLGGVGGGCSAQLYPYTPYLKRLLLALLDKYIATYQLGARG